MKQFILTSVFLLFAVAIMAQPSFDLGLKAGVNSSKVTTSLSEFTPESIVKMHIGAFGRIGWERIYLQPEAYFSAKGGDLNSGLLNTITAFDFNTVDVPVLFGVKVLKGELANARVMAGPVFSFLTTNGVSGDNRFTAEYFKNAYYGFQYGVGVDVWMFSLDARMDHGSNNLYSHPSLKSKNRTFMVSLGIKIF